MRTHTLLSFAAVSLAMLGCDSRAPEQKAAPPAQQAAPAVVAQATSTPTPAKVKPTVDKKCKKDDCMIMVTVSACAAGGITVNLPSVGITKGIVDVPIVWEIDGNKFEFTGNGIVVTAPSGVFVSKGPSPNNKQFTVIDTNSQPVDDKEYKYTVTVKPKNSGTPCPAYDPTIINGY